mgnify:CR=1 FL=1
MAIVRALPLAGRSSQISAIVTPPDVISQLALAIPMCILYEIGIVAARIFIKHTKAPETEGAEKAT